MSFQIQCDTQLAFRTRLGEGPRGWRCRWWAEVIQNDNALQVRFSATLGEEPEVEVALA